MAEEENEEVVKKKKSSKTLHKAMRNLSKAEEYYAKVIIGFANKTRLKLYKKIRKA